MPLRRRPAAWLAAGLLLGASAAAQAQVEPLSPAAVAAEPAPEVGLGTGTDAQSGTERTAAATPGDPAPGVDWALSAGAGSHQRVDKLGLIAGWTRPAPLWQGDRWRLVLHHEVELAAWRVPRARDLIELGYSPVLRLERPLQGGAVLFFEGAIGARLLSHTYLAPDHRLSTAFQFSDMLGMGLRWGRAQRASVGVRLQHLSNLGIKRPNPGIEFLQLYAAYRF